MDTSRTIMKFERLLFMGIPDSPESIWERDGYTHIHMRSTGRSVSGIDDEISLNKAKILGKVVYDFETGEETYIPVVTE